jgi:arylsulfatase A-like enzyme
VNKRILLAVAAVAILLTGLLGWHFSRGSRRAPHVLVVTCDTLRADRLGLYGHGRPTSPNLDALAKESVVFDRFFANASFTPPSHGSILTGLYPNAHGVLWWNDTLLPGAQTIGEILGTPEGQEGKSGFGYRTAAFVNLDNFEQLGLTRGFEHVRSQTWFPGDDLNRDFFAWVDKGRTEGNGKRVCAWLHYWDPHRPYAYRTWEWLKPNKTPAEIAAMEPREQASYKKLFLSSQRKPLTFHETLFGTGDLGIGRVEAHYNRSKGEREAPIHVPPNQNRILTADDDRFLVDRYDGGVKFLDECLGALVQGLRERGMLDETILVITSDHGETFTERDDEWFTHDPHLYDEVTRIPCLVRFPKGELGGTRVARVSQAVDLTPTVLDYLGLAGEGFHGVSLLPAIDGRGLAPRPAVSQTQDKQLESKGSDKFVLTNRKYSIRDDTHRHIAWGTGEKEWEKVELYDAIADPKAKVPLDSTGPEAKARLAALRKWLDETPPRATASRVFTPGEEGTLNPGGYFKSRNPEKRDK